MTHTAPLLLLAAVARSVVVDPYVGSKIIGEALVAAVSGWGHGGRSQLGSPREEERTDDGVECDKGEKRKAKRVEGK